MNGTSPSVLDQAYLNLRREFGRVPLIKSKLPEFVRRCESLGEFWSFSKAKHGTYPCWNTSKQKTGRPV
jgi:hypothetical protein